MGSKGVGTGIARGIGRLGAKQGNPSNKTYGGSIIRNNHAFNALSTAGILFDGTIARSGDGDGASNPQIRWYFGGAAWNRSTNATANPVPTLGGFVAAARNSSTMPLRNFSSSSSARKSTTAEDCGPVETKLGALIAGGSVQPDPHQLFAAREFDRLYNDLIEATKATAAEPTKEEPSSQNDSSGFFLSGIFGGLSDLVKNDNANDNETEPSGATGIYTYGGVGCGKTFLMELFFGALDDDPTWSGNKQIVHFHKFMLNVHRFMHTSKKEQLAKGIEDGDPIESVVDHILKSGKLLCLDEFQVTDVADAMILKQVFGRLWKRGCVLVTTSNRPPRDLYLNGLQRDRFLPFVDLLENKCTVVSLMDNDVDYRMVISAMDDDNNNNNEEEEGNDTKSVPLAGTSLNGSGGAKLSTPGMSEQYYSGKVYLCGDDQENVLRKLFYEWAGGKPTNPSSLETQGRTVKIPIACAENSTCMFSFKELCQEPLGAIDYLVISQHFSTIFVHGIPLMTTNEINWLRRFITFVDSAYEWKVRVVLQTNANSVEEIFQVEDKESYQQDEVFAFDRTRSRLGEMSSSQYRSSPWRGQHNDGSDATTSTGPDNHEPNHIDRATA